MIERGECRGDISATNCYDCGYTFKANVLQGEG